MIIRRDELLKALASEQLAAEKLYKDLLDVSVSIFAEISLDEALQKRYDAYLEFTETVEAHKFLTQKEKSES